MEDTSNKISLAKIQTVSSFQRFCFDNATQQHSKEQKNSIEVEKESETVMKMSPMCTFLDKVQAIFIDEISGAPISETESSGGKGKSWVYLAQA